MAPAEYNDAPRVKLEAWMATDVGVVRPHNEDTAHVDGDRAFFIVADGMGGHAAGEVASAMAVETVRTKLESARRQFIDFASAPSDVGRRSLVQLLQDAVLSAHQAVFQRGSTEDDKNGMGTTLDVLLISGTEAFIAHVGDSRTYLIRDGRASQLTTDHTYAEVMVIEGKLTMEEAQVSQLRNILVNAVGVSAEVGVEMAHLELRRGDRLLLCSDGLHDYFPGDTEIAERLVGESGGDTSGGLTALVELAKTRGGHDNITGIAIQVVDIVSPVGSISQDETQPVTAVDPRSSDDEHTENTAVPAADSDAEASDGAADRDSDGDGEVSGGDATDKSGKRKRSKRPSPKPENKIDPKPTRPLRKSRPTRDKLTSPDPDARAERTTSAPSSSPSNRSEEDALADTLPPTLISPIAKPESTGDDSGTSRKPS
jgi:serine/threonine protein phosphatase PrpC